MWYLVLAVVLAAVALLVYLHFSRRIESRRIEPVADDLTAPPAPPLVSEEEVWKERIRKNKEIYAQTPRSDEARQASDADNRLEAIREANAKWRIERNTDVQSKPGKREKEKTTKELIQSAKDQAEAWRKVAKMKYDGRRGR